MKNLAAALTVLVSTLIALLLVEAGYRVLLIRDVPDRFAYTDTTQMEVFDVSHWVFDEQAGYGYPPERKISHTAIRDGNVVSCTLINVINERGNIGPIEGDYDTADLKIAVFGDSWSAFNQAGVTWTDLFQRELAKRTGKSVHVLNFGRDGYGILQMFDLAARELPEWNPDLAIFAFITNDLARVRTWRHPQEVDGVTDRVLTSFEPDRDIDLETTYDTFLVHAAATNAWCNNAKESGDGGVVIAEIEEKYQRARRAGGQRPADIYSLETSYLFNRVRYGDPFEGLPELFTFPVLEIDSYEEDARFMESLAAIKDHPATKILFHMAFYPEVRDGEEYIVNFREAALLESLLETTGFPIVETLENVETPVQNPERMNATPTNFHPSLWGMEFYTKAMINGLEKQGLLDTSSGRAANN